MNHPLKKMNILIIFSTCAMNAKLTNLANFVKVVNKICVTNATLKFIIKENVNYM